MTDHDRLHAIDSVDTDGFRLRHDRDLAVFLMHRLPEITPKASRGPDPARTENDEYTLATQCGIDSSCECGGVVSGHDKTDSPDHGF